MLKSGLAMEEMRTVESHTSLFKARAYMMFSWVSSGLTIIVNKCVQSNVGVGNLRPNLSAI